MNIAIEGCCHGQLDEIYKQIEKSEKVLGITIDLLIICGDFQALRNNMDMDLMHCPQKYKKLGNFYEYYNGTRDPYVTTVFIGGNHEAVNYSRELYFGGWASRGIYYLGQAGSIYVSKGDTKIRISGLSGIFNFRSFMNNKLEMLPLSGSDLITTYHCKQLEIFRMELLATNTNQPFDIFLSHDWPTGITKFGNEEDLLNIKPFFKEDIGKNELGNSALEYLSSRMQPSYWFSAHLHVKFAAARHYEQSGRNTHFLALDKCMKGRDCLQIVKLHREGQQIVQGNIEKQPSKKPNIVTIEHDLEWLTVLKMTENMMLKGQMLYKFQQHQMVPIDPNLLKGYSKQFNDVKQNLKERLENKLLIPESLFRETVLAGPGNYRKPDAVKINNQTQNLLELIGSDYERYRNVLYYNNEKQQTKKHQKAETEGWQQPNEPPSQLPKPANDQIDLDV